MSYLVFVESADDLFGDDTQSPNDRRARLLRPQPPHGSTVVVLDEPFVSDGLVVIGDWVVIDGLVVIGDWAAGEEFVACGVVSNEIVAQFLVKFTFSPLSMCKLCFRLYLKAQHKYLLSLARSTRFNLGRLMNSSENDLSVVTPFRFSASRCTSPVLGKSVMALFRKSLSRDKF